MFLPVSLSKSKFFTRVALVSFVYHSCCICVALVSLVSHSCRTRVASVALMLHSCRSCRTRVARVWHSCCILDQIFLFLVLKYFFASLFWNNCLITLIIYLCIVFIALCFYFCKEHLFHSLVCSLLFSLFVFFFYLYLLSIESIQSNLFNRISKLKQNINNVKLKTKQKTTLKNDKLR